MAKLQDLSSNLNPNYDAGIDVSNDLYAFIDESGDEGFDFSNTNVSRWFNVSAIICRPTVAVEMVQYIRGYRDNKFPTKPLEKMDSKDLTHGQRRDIFSGLNSFDFTTTHSLFYKPNIDPNNRLVTYPSMYFVGVLNVLERMSWYTQQEQKNKVHVIISNRNHIRKEDMTEYLFKSSVRSKTNLAYLNKFGLVKLANFNQRPQLLLADYAAYTLRMAFEEIGTPPRTEPYYFDMFQKGKLFNSTHSKWSGIWGCGLKCTPSDKSLVKHGGILNEGSH